MTEELSETAALLAALTAAVLLAVVHVAAPRVRTLPGVPERVIGSFGGGIAVAYVFVHLLPELAEGSEGVGEALGEVVEITPLLDLAIFVVALGGFTAFYGLERLAQRTGSRRGAPAPVPGSAPGADGASGAGRADGTDDAEPPPGVFWLHLGAFAVYDALITYTLPLRLRTGVAFAVLFTAAMALHLVLTDRGLAEHYPRRFARVGRPVLAAAVLGGWCLALVAAPTGVVVVSLLTALLGGAILLNVVKEELPGAGRSSFPWFLGGVVLYAALLALVTALGE